MARFDAVPADVPFFKRVREQGEEYKGPYELWKELVGIPTIGDYYVRDLRALELTPWVSRGGK